MWSLSCNLADADLQNQMTCCVFTLIWNDTYTAYACKTIHHQDEAVFLFSQNCIIPVFCVRTSESSVFVTDIWELSRGRAKMKKCWQQNIWQLLNTDSFSAPHFSCCLSQDLEALEYKVQLIVLAVQLVCNDFWQQWRQTEEHVCLCMCIYKSTLGNRIPVLETLLHTNPPELLHVQDLGILVWNKMNRMKSRTRPCKTLASYFHQINVRSFGIKAENVSDLLE